MPVLHLVNRAGALSSCLARAGDDDVILLLEDGAYAAVSSTDRRLHALAADVRGRGLLERLPDQITVVDDAGFVELAVTHQPIVTWR